MGGLCKQGPSLKLSLVLDAGCARGARITGWDQRLVRYVDFVAAGRELARDEQAPFEQTLAPESTSRTRLRAVAFLTDGRRVTLDKVAAPCA